MGFTGIAVGTFFGLSTKLGSNVLQKVPYMRHPWEHVIFMGVGAGLGGYLQNKYHRDLEEVEELRLYLERRPDVNKKE
ncbi:mitochondrial protein [Phytophthora palmivora]|uniref:Mitochondrial protein n=1 Tax=Phytophthora palmivora TaxID=4796 RepID=A0A2P4XI66_9STRA|nr:mitochondrial protein [Phytophthora palmivora]